MDYTLSQATAIACTDQNLQVIACAGSGKRQAEEDVHVVAEFICVMGRP